MCLQQTIHHNTPKIPSQTHKDAQTHIYTTHFILTPDMADMIISMAHVVCHCLQMLALLDLIHMDSAASDWTCCIQTTTES